MRRLTKILIGVAIAFLLVAVLVLTLVIVLRKEEWIVLEKSFASINDECTADWGGSSDWKRTRCKMPLICAATKDQATGYCKLPMSELEGKSCAASVHLCAMGLTCDPYLKICRRLISVGGSCTEQNAFLCESGICGYASNQTLEGEPLGGRHSLSRYCIVKDLPPGAACDRFRHCVSDCLQCIQGVCKPVISPLDQQQMLLEQQKDLILPLAVNGFSANQDQDSSEDNVSRRLQQGSQNLGYQQHSSFEGSPVGEANKSTLPQQQYRQQHLPREPLLALNEQEVRSAWDQRAAEVSTLLGENLTAEDLAAFFAVPRDSDGQPLNSRARFAEDVDEAISGQQANWSDAQIHALQQQQQQQQMPPSRESTNAPARNQPQPVLNGSLAKRLARLFAGVSYAFTPESQQGSLASAFGSPMHGFPSAIPPPLPNTLATAGRSVAPQQPSYASSVLLDEENSNSMLPQRQEQMPSQMQRLRQEQQQRQFRQQQYQQGYSPYDSSLEAMEASNGNEAAEGPSGLPNESEEDGGELEGLFFPGVVRNANNPLQLLGITGRNSVGTVPPLGLPQLSLQRPLVAPRLQSLLPLNTAPISPLAPAPPAVLPPMGTVPLVPPPVGIPMPPIQSNPNIQTPVAPPPPFNQPVAPLPGLPNRLPPNTNGGCWVDRCCASHHYCSFLHAFEGCQARKREGAPCVGDSARECEDQLSCVNGECSPWFTSRHASSGDTIVLTDNVDINSVCAPWQRFEFGHSIHSPHPHDMIPPQMALPSPLDTPNPYGNSLARDVMRSLRKFSGRCVTLDKRSCVTDRECWGLGGFGFCDVRSKRCRSPAYPACLATLKDLYGCLWHEGRLRETTDDYIVSQVPRTPQFLLHEAPVSVNHVQSKCIPSMVRRKRAELLKCVQSQGFTLERIIEVPDDWFKG